jgi:CubicO group peptidase (beta-lactamase class C family)
MRVRVGWIVVLSFVGTGCSSRGRNWKSASASPRAIPTATPCVTTPEEQGMDSNVLSRAFRDMDGEGLHSLLVVRNGCLVVEAYWLRYHRERKHYLNSATKAVLSALVGIAVHDGKLREDELVLPHFPEHLAPDVDPRKRRITVKHLLTMSSGIFWPQSSSENASDQMGRSSDWVQFILDRPMAAEPGSVTNYSNGDSHLLSALLQKATGATALDFARKRLFEPLGITDVAWDSDPQGRSIGSAALQMRPVDMATFGSLYLSYGESDGRSIVDRDWVKRSLTGQVKMPTRGGPADYGYYWWLYPERNLSEAWGGAGQRIALFRDLGLVIVMTADIANDFPRSPSAARLYDAIRQSAKSSGPLPANPSAVSNLKRSIADLTGR